MNESFVGTSTSKAAASARAINLFLRNLVLQCQRGNEIRDYYQVGIVGYGDTVGPAFRGDLIGQKLVRISMIADYPARMITEPLEGNPNLLIDRPIWVDGKANGGTPMKAGIDLAGSILVDWANRHLNSFPPIVINISGGAATGGDPRLIASQLRDIRTRDGNLLFFNAGLQNDSLPPIEFPNSSRSLQGRYANGLFEMSSELTPYMIAFARGADLPVRHGSRGFVFNADAEKLAELLQVGTRVSTVD